MVQIFHASLRPIRELPTFGWVALVAVIVCKDVRDAVDVFLVSPCQESPPRVSADDIDDVCLLRELYYDLIALCMCFSDQTVLATLEVRRESDKPDLWAASHASYALYIPC